MSNPLPGHQVAFISACIAGDHRYTSQIVVSVDGDKVHVARLENSAVGGMDGPGGSTPFVIAEKRTVDAKPALVLSAVKSVIDTTIKRYGKPTKNFHWYGVGYGLSVGKCKAALDVLKD